MSRFTRHDRPTPLTNGERLRLLRTARPPSPRRPWTGVLLTILCALCVLWFFLALSGCDGGRKVHPVQAAGTDVELPAMQWRMRDAKEIDRLYARAGMTLHPGERIDAFIGKQAGRTVIYTRPPVRVDDDVACALGHEVMHAGLGQYHP